MDFKLISDPDPDERDYTGNLLIAEKEGKHGLVHDRDGEYKVLYPFVHTKITDYLMLYTKDDNNYYVYSLHHENGKKGFIIADDHFFSGYEYDEIYFPEDNEEIIGVEKDGKQGYCDLEEGYNAPGADIIWFK